MINPDLEAASVALAVGVKSAWLGPIAHVARVTACPVGVAAARARPVALAEHAWRRVGSRFSKFLQFIITTHQFPYASSCILHRQ